MPLMAREVWGSIVGWLDWMQCRQRLATAATFLQSCVAHAEIGTATCYRLRRNAESIMKIVFFFIPKHSIKSLVRVSRRDNSSHFVTSLDSISDFFFELRKCPWKTLKRRLPSPKWRHSNFLILKTSFQNFVKCGPKHFQFQKWWKNDTS